LSEWRYQPAADLDQDLASRLRDFPRQPHIWMFLLRSLVVLFLRCYLKLYHRFEVQGREHLPLGKSFVLVANHQSHLDALSLCACLPLRFIHRAFPAAAADYFFASLPTSLFSATVINALPFDRERKGEESLAICQRLLETEGNILVLFPEGTRSATGELARFRSGVGRIVQGSETPVVPCYLEGAYRALSKGALFPRPHKLRLRIGAPRCYRELSGSKEAVQEICADLHAAVAALGDL